ncbi:MAG: DUF4168 domain-containing protein [Gammaproteobacteria bacterium]
MNLRPITTLSALVAVLAVAPIQAQEAANTPPPKAAEAAAATQAYGDATLRQFAKATQKVAEIRNEYSAKIGNTQDQNKAQELQQEAHGKMVDAITGSDLDLPTYNAIAEQIARDTQLEERVKGFM